MLKLPRILIASLGLCTVVGVALAQQSPSDPQPRRTGTGRFDTRDDRRGPDDAPVVPRVTYVAPAGGDNLPKVAPVPYVANQGFFRAFTPASAEEMNLAHQAEQLAHKLSEAKSDSDRDKIKGDLRDRLEKQFEQRQGRHEKEIEALEAQVKKLKDLVRKRNDNRREIVSKRLDQILSDAEGLGW